jgi:cellulose synthase/poly-beta-1,6-N-acetylglucosamine synthase-like glycosyltransferase
MEVVTKKSILDRHWFQRILEIIPGFVMWSCILGPVVLSLIHPIAVAYFIIAFDLFWLVKSMRMSFFLIRGYTNLHRSEQVRWRNRLDDISDPEKALARIDHQIEALSSKYPQIMKRFLKDPRAMAVRPKYRELQKERTEVLDLISRKATILDPKLLKHAVIIATYNESLEVLESSIVGLTEIDYPLDQIMLIIAYEERGGEATAESVKHLIDKYGKQFGYARAIMHPDGLPGEAKAKGANITYAGRELTKYIESQGIDPEYVVVTTFDADHRPSKNYFALLSYRYASNVNRIHLSYQPVPMFFNNIWDVPAPMRLIATGNSFWMIMESMRPQRLRNFAAHAQSLKALIETDYWSVTSIVEDGHQYWRSYFAFDGDHQVVPLLTPIYQDAVLAEGYLRTFRAQYLQLRRWGWGVSEFPYVVTNSFKNKRIGWGNKLLQTWRLFEGHLSWATAPVILSFVAWLPLYLNQQFAKQVLAHQLPIIASRIMTVAMIGIVVTITISLISLPPKPARYHRGRNISMVLQWFLLPFTALIFSAAASIDSQTRLMIGKYLDTFRVTEKVRKK